MTGKFPLAWPDYPAITTTLLAAVGIAGVFLGIGTLTSQSWVVWLGLIVAVSLLGYHVVRYRRARAQRALTQTMLGAHLISHCRHFGGPKSMQEYYRGGERVVLILTDDALHICPDDSPLQIFTTVPLYALQVAEVEGRAAEADLLPVLADLKDQKEMLSLGVQLNSYAVQRLLFCDFEKNSPPTCWAHALNRMLRPRAMVPS